MQLSLLNSSLKQNTKVILDDLHDYSDKCVKEFKIKPLLHEDVNEFICHWHYSKSINGVRISYIFGLFYENDLIGAMLFGDPAMHNSWKKYGEKEEDVIELRRLCCVNNTPPNTESYFIGYCLKWLKKNTSHKTVVSYADAYHNHQGIIYKASNFQYHGLTPKGKMINHQGLLYHDKAIRTYFVDKFGKKRLKPFAIKLKEALNSGEAFYFDTPGKHIFTYNLK